MKYDKLCEKCANDPDAYVGGTLYTIVPPEECPRCKTREAVRFAMASWLMMILGSAVTLLYALKLSYGIAGKIGIDNSVCNFTWILLLSIAFWAMTSSIGKWVAKKLGIIGDGDTEWGE